MDAADDPRAPARREERLDLVTYQGLDGWYYTRDRFGMGIVVGRGQTPEEAREVDQGRSNEVVDGSAQSCGLVVGQSATTDGREEDKRNLRDEFKYFPVDLIRARLAERRRPFATLALNIDYDLNIATIVRSHNAFCGQEFFYLGRRKYNRKGCVGTYIYENITHLRDLDEALSATKERYTWVGIDNRPGAVPLTSFEWPDNPLLIFGHEGEGLDFLPHLAYHCKHVVMIPQIGSVRSLNVGVAAGITMYDLCTKKGWL